MPRKNTKVTDVTPATTAPKTLAEKLAAAKALVAKYEQQINAENIKNDIAKGDEVSFLFGRGDSRRTMTGTVAGFKDSDQGKIVAILSEEDGLPETRRVNIRDITVNKSADLRRAAVPGAGDATVEIIPADPAPVVMDATGLLVAANADADPLNAA